MSNVIHIITDNLPACSAREIEAAYRVVRAWHSSPKAPDQFRQGHPLGEDLPWDIAAAEALQPLGTNPHNAIPIAYRARHLHRWIEGGVFRGSLSSGSRKMSDLFHLAASARCHLSDGFNISDWNKQHARMRAA